MTTVMPRIGKLTRFSLTTADAERATTFYETAFGCRRLCIDRLGGADFEKLMGVRGGATRIVLALGQEILELVQFDSVGASFPTSSTSYDLVFQHFAIVVSDMGQAYEHLVGIKGWAPISRDRPQRLPESSGGVTAFKFRDPEGHPLELLAFPRGVPSFWSQQLGVFLGIDHSAICVSDSAASIAFYESIGLLTTGRSLNRGAEQESLDNVHKALVEVTTLAAQVARPHLELLCYRNRRRDPAPKTPSNDIASTRLVFATFDRARFTQARLFRDPDGHALIISASER